MKKGLITICLCSCLLLSGCGDKKTSGSIEEAKKSSNSVICTSTNDLNYYDIEALQEQKAGTYKEGYKDRNHYIDEEEERKALEEEERKKSIKTGTITREAIYEFNDSGTEIKNIYIMINNTFTHEEATDDLIKANKDYLDNYYKNNGNDYEYVTVTIKGKSVIREMKYNLSNLSESARESLKITKEKLISNRSRNNEQCIAN